MNIQSNTNINGMNRFYPLSFIDTDSSFGAITRLRVRDNYLKCFQELKIGVIPIFNQISKDANGRNILVVTDKLLNPIQYRIGNFGLSAPESLASHHFADYGCDVNKGVIWRDSNDGVEPISELYKVSSWALYELPLRKGDIKIYGAFNPKLNTTLPHALFIVILTGMPVPTLAEVGVPYRKPYTTRKTSVRHSLLNGGNYIEVYPSLESDSQIIRVKMSHKPQITNARGGDLIDPQYN